MKKKAIRNFESRSYKRHIFKVFRHELRFFMAPIFVVFGVLDFIYRPDLAPTWLIYRATFPVAVFGLFELLKNRSLRDKHFRKIVIGTIFLSSNIVNLMVAESGGWQSLYITGLILITTTGNALFRLNRRDTLLANLGSYLPAVAICFWSGYKDGQLVPACAQASFLVGITALEWIYKAGQYSVEQFQARLGKVMEREIQELRRNDFLKKHFPAKLRKELDLGSDKLFEKRIIPSAVVGFADITSSTSIGNQVSLMTDWNIKELFLEAATKRATACDLIVLTHVGDGFLFLANYDQGNDWPTNIIAFYEGLLRDFQQIHVDFADQIGDIDTGVKLGVTMGPVVIGFIGSDQSYFTAMGPEVNLAARLCSKANNNEIVLGTRIWHVLKHLITGWKASKDTYLDLKGFGPVSAVRLEPRGMSTHSRVCETCGQGLNVMRNPQGFIDLLCINGHIHVASENTSNADLLKIF